MSSRQASFDQDVEEILQAFADEDLGNRVHADAEDLVPQRRDPLDHFRSFVPDEAIHYVEEIARTREVQSSVLNQVSDHICRRLPSLDSGEEGSRVRWNRAWKYQQERVKSRMKRTRDEVVRNAHCIALHVPPTLRKLPKKYLGWKTGPDEPLRVSDPKTPQADLGNASYLEHTPGEVVRFVHQTWRSNRGSSKSFGPDVWDITAGGGTVAHYFSVFGTGRCVSSDLVTLGDDVIVATAQMVGRLEQHTTRPVIGRDIPLRIAHPDIVFFDPPSIGTPTHSGVYEASGFHADLATLHPEAWVQAVAEITVRAARRLNPEGLVSLLIRHGYRTDDRVHELPELLDAISEMVCSPSTPRHLEIVQRNRIEYGNHRLNQPGLGMSRVPATHLLLGRLP